MRLRALILAITFGFAMGIVGPPAAFEGEPARLLATFLGIVAASILPTITLLVNSMDHKGRSVARIRHLRDQIAAAMRELFVLFALISATLGLLLSFAWLPGVVEAWSLPHPDLTRRVLLGLVAYALVVLIQHAMRVPEFLLRCLDVRAETAEREGVKQTGAAAALPDGFFPSPGGFGERVEHSRMTRPLE